ncbi:MAG TPA: phosphatase PAP2 family protein [Eudoraea sp.]|nr:phosphatase PAP2 family protein [Eudoraea sp.]
MMRLFLKIISYIFHPLLIPFAGTVTYFLVTPKYSPLELQSGNILPIFILTVIIPIISFFILRNLGIVTSVFLPDKGERKYPLMISITLLFMVLIKVIPNNYIVELYYFFIGLIAASFACLLMIFINLKCSLHLMGMGSLLMFLISLSIHFEINITIAISLWTLVTGLVATSRLYLNAHSRTEVLVGFLIGFTSQLLTIRFWM